MSTMPIYALVDTWNASGTTFTAVKMTVTDTASASGSLLMDLQVGGTSQFKVGKGGVVSVGSTLELGHASDTTLARASAGVVTIEGNTVYTSGNLPGTSVTWAAGQTFSAENTISMGDPAGSIFETDGPTDEKRWRWYISDGDFVFVGLNDAISSSGQILSISRNGIASFALTLSAALELNNVNIPLGTSTGTKIGTATNQKLAFYNATPVVQPTAVADATDAASVITQLNALLTRMRNLGLIAT
jgi:hypothetical protein